MKTTSYLNVDARRIVSALLLFSVLIAAGCGPKMGPDISIKWRSPKTEVKKGTPVTYMSLRIGEVIEVRSVDDDYYANVRLLHKYAHYVREESTFLVQKGRDGQEVFIEVRPIKKDSPPAPDGAVLTGSESGLQAGVRALVTDWKRTATLAVVAVGAIILLLLLTKLFFKFWALVACVAGGVIAAKYLSPLVDQRIHGLLPTNVRSDLIAYAVAFLAGYIVANIIVGILFRPLRSRRKG